MNAPLTYRATRNALRRIGVALTHTGADALPYAVALVGRGTDNAYYTDHLLDALDAGRAMIDNNRGRCTSCGERFDASHWNSERCGLSDVCNHCDTHGSDDA